MKADFIVNKLLSVSNSSGSGPLRRYLFVFTIIAIIAVLGLIFSFEEIQSQSSLFNSKPVIINSHSIDNSFRGNYVLTENDDFTLDNSKKIHEQFSTAIPKLLTIPFISPFVTSLFDAIDYSPLIKSFASLPLRSPPLFS